MTATMVLAVCATLLLAVGAFFSGVAVGRNDWKATLFGASVVTIGMTLLGLALAT